MSITAHKRGLHVFLSLHLYTGDKYKDIKANSSEHSAKISSGNAILTCHCRSQIFELGHIFHFAVSLRLDLLRRDKGQTTDSLSVYAPNTVYAFCFMVRNGVHALQRRGTTGCAHVGLIIRYMTLWGYIQKWDLLLSRRLSMTKFSRADYSDCQTSNLRTRTEMVFETLVCSPLNHLTRLIPRENFIIYPKVSGLSLQRNIRLQQ
jgi:hypothetical protein